MRTMLVGLIAAALLGGCGLRKDHLTRSYGESFDTAFAAQRERRDKAPAQAATGLDSQEATLVTGSYYASLAPKGAPKEQPVILVAPGANRDNTRPLAPSVPKE